MFAAALPLTSLPYGHPLYQCNRQGAGSSFQEFLARLDDLVTYIWRSRLPVNQHEGRPSLEQLCDMNINGFGNGIRLFIRFRPEMFEDHLAGVCAYARAGGRDLLLDGLHRRTAREAPPRTPGTVREAMKWLMRRWTTGSEAKRCSDEPSSMLTFQLCSW